VPVEMVISSETLIETENSCWVPRFPLIASCYKIVNSQTSFTLWKGRSLKFWKGWSRTFCLRLRNRGLMHYLHIVIRAVSLMLLF